MSSISFAAGSVGSHAHVRLTPRGKVVFGGIAAALALVVSFIIASPLAGAELESSRSVSAQSVVFEYESLLAGETLWSFAERIAPSADPRIFIDDVLEFNALSSTAVKPGQVLAIPSKYLG